MLNFFFRYQMLDINSLLFVGFEREQQFILLYYYLVNHV